MKRTITAFLFGGILLLCSWAAEPPAGDRIVRHVSSVRFPKVGIETASAKEVFDFIASKFLQFDPKGGISFLTAGDIPTTTRTVNYHRADIDVGTLFQDLAQLYGVDIHITSVGAVMTPSGVLPFPNHKAATGTTFRSYKAVLPKNK